MVACSSRLYSSTVTTNSAPTPDSLEPWEVARALRWAVAKGFLLDPILWLAVLAIAWAGRGLGGLSPMEGVVGVFLLALLIADSLLFRSTDNPLLRAQPLGDNGLLRVRQAELSWMLRPLQVLLLLIVSGQAGWALGLGATLLSLLFPAPALRGALFLRALHRAPRTATAAFGAGASGLFERLAGEATTRPSRGRWLLWPILERLIPLPRGLRARLVRDLVLLARGQDLRGAFLLLLSPLSYLVLRDDLAHLRRTELLSWRALTAAALGGAAVAYAVGPGIHLLRARVMSWERISRHPGSQALRSALVYALAFALLHGVGTLATVHFAQAGRFADHVPGLVAPVLTLELAMAHFVVVFTMGASTGRSILGEGTLVLALPIIAVGVAIAGWFNPWIAALYFLVTTGMAAGAASRYEDTEVLW